MKLSAFTMVSRFTPVMKQAIYSVWAQEPDDYVAYVDPVAFPEGPERDRVIAFLEDLGLHCKMMELKYPDHYADCCATVYRGILEAKHPWVLDCDDDDLVLSQVRDRMGPYTDADVGAIYGHKIQVMHDSVRLVPAWDIYTPFEIIGMRGSAIMYNRDAFSDIYQNLDIFRGEVDESFGYFWEYKIGYWLLRARYRMLSCNEIMVLQHWNYSRNPKIRSLAHAWYPMVVRNRDKLPLLRSD